MVNWITVAVIGEFNLITSDCHSLSVCYVPVLLGWWVRGMMSGPPPRYKQLRLLW